MQQVTQEKPNPIIGISKQKMVFWLAVLYAICQLACSKWW